MLSVKALVASVVSVVALFVIVVGTFTATSDAEPAEAGCLDISCLIEFLSPESCNDSDIEGAGFGNHFGSQCCVGQVGGANFGNQCCVSQVGGANFGNQCCVTEQGGAIFGNQCCQNGDGGGGAVGFNLGCECGEQPGGLGGNAAFLNGSGNVMSQLFGHGLLTLFRFNEPCAPSGF